MLPPAGCIDPAVFSWEQKYFLGGGWTCVGFCAELAHPADQRAESIGDGSVLLSRDDDGVLRAFANYCRHAATSCCRAAYPLSARASCARTTPGPMRSTAA